MRRRTRGPAAWAAALTLGMTLAALWGIGGAASMRPEAPPQGLVLSAFPTSGSAPLLVQFSVSFPNGTPPALHWEFGDGSPMLNGSGSSEGHPAHLYALAGTFLCIVTAVWPAGSENASTSIRVTPGDLNLTASASTENGSAPLTVWFNATVHGGSGTYIAYLWGFGDGNTGSGLSLRYTYASPGRYVANFTVIDSTNRSAVRSFTIEVHPGPSPKSSNGSTEGGAGSTISLTNPLTLALGVSGAAVLLSCLFWIRRSRTASRERPHPGTGVAPEGAVAQTSVLPGTPASDAVPVPSPGPVGPSDSVVEGRGPATPDALPAGLVTPQLLTYQLIRHLSTLPRLWPGDLPTRAWTQAGIAEAVGAGQSAISRILRRLVAANVVTVETLHVRDSNRRMRVYRLTERGERLGRALHEPPHRPPDA